MLVATIRPEVFDRFGGPITFSSNGPSHQIAQTLGTEIVVVSQQDAISGGHVATLRRLTHVFSRALTGDLLEKFTFGIALASLVPLVDGDWNEVFVQHFHNCWIREFRHTVEHTIVSRAGQWMPVHRPNKQRLFLFGGQPLC